MRQKPLFWLALGVMQVFVVLIVFLVTRNYYVHKIDEPNEKFSQSSKISEIAAMTKQGLETSQLDANTFNQYSAADPETILSRAQAAFQQRDFSTAAELYHQLHLFDQKNVDTLNNLGLTLHYIGRTDEALVRLKEGLSLDSGHQRSWLTLGYIYSQQGDSEQAKTALDTARTINPENEIGRSAASMLSQLP